MGDDFPRLRLGRAITEAERKRRVDKRRLYRASRCWYGQKRWKDRRRRQLEKHPNCKDCEANGVKTIAKHADHVPPHNEDEWQFFHGPLESRCATCHNRKTARFDGGFGNPKRKQDSVQKDVY